ncbi:MAG TPA: hypothetical protein VFL41_11380 [Gaiellaceae bacterium]|nr:hypothetical protein [Gaiellaceae bacterium]
MPHRLIADRVRELGPTLVGGLVLLAAGLWAFGAIAEEVAEGDTGLDDRLARWLHAHATDSLTTFFKALTELGNGVVLAGVTAIAVYLLARRRLYREALLMVLAFTGAEVLCYGLKLGFRRDRAFFTNPLGTESTYSFPSGQATVSLATYGALAVVLARHVSRRWRPLLFARGGSARLADRLQPPLPRSSLLVGRARRARRRHGVARAVRARARSRRALPSPRQTSR